MRIENIETKKYPIYLANRTVKIKSITAIPDITYDATGEEYLLLSIYLNDKKIFSLNTDPDDDGKIDIYQFQKIPLILDPFKIYPGDVLYLDIIKRGEDKVTLTVFVED